MAAKRKGKKAPDRNRSRAETDRPSEAESEIASADGEQHRKPGRNGTDRPSSPGDRPNLTAKQRAFAEALVADPDRNGWRAAWVAGYGGGGPDLPLPEAVRKRQTLAQQASHAANTPAVKAYIAELNARATAAFLAGPQGEVIREHIEAREARVQDVEKLAALNLDLIVQIAHHDPRTVVEWGPGFVEVKHSRDLDYAAAVLVREVKNVESHSENGTTTTTFVRFHDRAPYVKMLEQRLGKAAPLRHEFSGPGGGPIEAHLGVSAAPTEDQLDEVAMELLGIVPAKVSDTEAGLSLDEVRTVLAGWDQDPDPHRARAWELFELEHWEETKARYLGDEV